MNMFFKIFGSIFCLLFVVFTFLQYNDPDPLVWMIIWAIAAAASFVFVINRISFKITLVLGILAFVGFLVAFPSDFQGFDLDNGDRDAVEKGREAFGLLLISVVMFVYAFRLKQTKES